MNNLLIFGVLVIAGIGGYVWLSNAPDAPPRRVEAVNFPQLSALATEGETVFQDTCAACHGADLRGTDQGPPLLHAFYKPAHHGDFAIVNAVQNGSRQHHWQFGDMPAQKHITDEQLPGLISYIREMQRANGIQ